MLVIAFRCGQHFLKKLTNCKQHVGIEIYVAWLFRIESLEVFENIAWTMAKHADPQNVPDNPDDWLEQFNCFSIYEVLPQLFELWGMNLETQAESKKISPS